MEFDEFMAVYRALRELVIRAEGGGVEEARRQLGLLAEGIGDPPGRERAVGQIEMLAGQVESVLSVSAGWSPEMKEAARLMDVADFDSGTVEQRMAMVAVVRRQVWEIADRAGEDSARIRGLTRGLDSVERALEEGPPWLDSSRDGR
ncbi:hypothetical protein FB561_7435 [Kribbella amoyensis]|uniref:Uncharacterized protein n=1 Tax=Kribbella amoyensis TaxID=996641 RepID=A0A561B0Q9_9ACTN|nr:hypothetical protein [Kribbella amoyensis]TWD72443.1 hypothetical protein FB561_7435 [Kribbella amoyensis]